jgi:hypothetical protein
VRIDNTNRLHNTMADRFLEAEKSITASPAIAWDGVNSTCRI